MAKQEKEHCCEEMKKQLKFDCQQHKDIFDCPDNLIYYSAGSKRYGLIVHDGGSSFILIEFCPWCGSKLT